MQKKQQNRGTASETTAAGVATSPETAETETTTAATETTTTAATETTTAETSQAQDMASAAASDLRPQGEEEDKGS